ncbi:hypothetical protein PILCRDRAFT_92785 [Piloderma croceum F 1598]|uniref:Uncharacterized protein n=1 Tax=Piloderma croceum (strain F 1598) TaxID=765440 RepID=A0A0C3B9M4_PILCF|nr:hypothetical protein PILCRDRAFT_92785 [Piloderma croceum F 1598]
MPPKKAAPSKSKAAVMPPAARGRGRPSNEEEVKTVRGKKVSVAISPLDEDSEGDTEIVEPETPTRKRSKKKATSDWASDSDDDGDIEMSESPKKNRLTPAQRVRFVEIAKSVKPIKKEAKADFAVVVPTLVCFICKNKTAAKAVKPEASDESDGDVFKAPSIKAPVESKKKRGRAPVRYDSDDGEPVSGFEDDSPKERKKPKIVTVKKGLKGPDEEREDVKVDVKNKAKAVPGSDADDEEVYLEDYITSETPPDVDESNVNRDKHLLRSYEGLTNVKVAKIYSWSTSTGTGNPTYTEVLTKCASVNRNLLLSAVVFNRQSDLAVPLMFFAG